MLCVILNKYDCNKVRDRSIAGIQYMHVSKIHATLHITYSTHILPKILHFKISLFLTIPNVFFFLYPIEFEYGIS